MSTYLSDDLDFPTQPQHATFSGTFCMLSSVTAIGGCSLRKRLCTIHCSLTVRLHQHVQCLCRQFPQTLPAFGIARCSLNATSAFRERERLRFTDRDNLEKSALRTYIFLTILLNTCALRHNKMLSPLIRVADISTVSEIFYATQSLLQFGSHNFYF